MHSVDNCPVIQGSPQNLGSQGHQINESICLSLYIYVSHSPSYPWGVRVCVYVREKVGENENEKLSKQEIRSTLV